MKSLSLTTPHMIIAVGIPGSGKSYFAQQFGETFHAPVVSESTITTLAGDAANATKLALYQIDELLKTRQSIIVDGFTGSRTERSELAKRARAAGYEPLYIWVQTDIGTAKMRVTKDKMRPDHERTSDAYDSLLKKFIEPSASDHTIVISGKHTYATQARIVLKKLSAPRAEAASVETPPPRTEPTSEHSNVRNIVVR